MSFVMNYGGVYRYVGNSWYLPKGGYILNFKLQRSNDGDSGWVDVSEPVKKNIFSNYSGTVTPSDFTNVIVTIVGNATGSGFFRVVVNAEWGTEPDVAYKYMQLFCAAPPSRDEGNPQWEMDAVGKYINWSSQTITLGGSYIVNRPNEETIPPI